MPACSPLLATTELVGACVSHSLSADAAVSLKNDPHAFVFSKYGLDVDGKVNISIVENQQQTVHIALPCYKSLQDSIRSRAIDDDAFDEVSGGEILADYTNYVSRDGVNEYFAYKYGDQVNAAPTPTATKPTTPAASASQSITNGGK